MNKLTCNVESYDLVFENCDIIRIYPDEIDKISATHQDNITDLYNEDYCGTILNLIMILNENRDYIPFQEVDGLGFEKDKMPIFYRISWNDIAQIHINYTDGNKKWFFVDWSGTDEINNNQKTEIIDGRLHVSIDENNNTLNIKRKSE